jgi:branched-chain amino acid transport system ATP-binding protein
MSPIIELNNWAVGYVDEPIVRGVNLAIEQGTITTLMGGNGAGKSTLLKSVFGLGKRFDGSIDFAGNDITDTTPEQRLKSGLALVPQGRCNFPAMSVAENLLMGGYTLSRQEREVAIRRATDQFPMLKAKWNVPVGYLSGGQQQIIEIAMALMLKPRVLLLDEPTLGLAPMMMREIFETVQEIAARGVTVIIAEQNVMGALQFSDRAIVLEMGTLAVDGPAKTVLADPRVRVAYLGEDAA